MKSVIKSPYIIVSHAFNADIYEPNEEKHLEYFQRKVNAFLSIEFPNEDYPVNGKLKPLSAPQILHFKYGSQNRLLVTQVIMFETDDSK